jgi:hypothetical protein
MTSPVYDTAMINASSIDTILIRLIGQSNICRAGAADAIPDPFPAHITKYVAMGNVEIWDEDNGGWIDLVPGVNGAPKTSITHYGVCIELAYRLKQKYPNKQIKIFMLARGGAGMVQYPFPGSEGTNEFWSPSIIAVPGAGISRYQIARNGIYSLH